MEWGEFSDRQLQHVLDAGQAPLLNHATRDKPEIVPPAWRDVLKSAELTARFTHGALSDSADEVVDTCRDLGVLVTLLKGISISDQYYPEPHLRPMGDIDVLVPQQEYERVESAMLGHGYVRMADFHVGEGEPHGAPLFHPQRRVWIEPHTALFHSDARVHANSMFSPSNVAAGSVASTYHGRPVLRLTDELQLVYIASYWIRDLTLNPIDPSFVIPLLDAVYILKASSKTLDWDSLLASLDNEMAIASLYIMLSQITRYGFGNEIAPILPRLAARQRLVGPAELRALDILLDTCLVGGRKFLGEFGDRHPMVELTVLDTLLSSGTFAGKVLSLPWNLVFPPRVKDRYSIGYQTGRLARLLRRRH